MFSTENENEFIVNIILDISILFVFGQLTRLPKQQVLKYLLLALTLKLIDDLFNIHTLADWPIQGCGGMSRATPYLS